MLLSDLVLGFTRYGLWTLARHPAGRLCLHPGHDGDRAAHQGSAFGVAGGRGRVGRVAPVLPGDEFRRMGRRCICTRSRRSGLAACYVAAIPFFRNSLAGDVAFTAILFGGLAWLENRVAWMRRQRPVGPGVARGGRMRVVSLLASGTEIVCGLGAGEWLVGRSHECDNPPWVAELPACTRPAFDISMSSGQIDAEVRRRLKAGEPLYHVDTELIDSLKPDLLITQEHCEVCAVTPADVERAGCVVAGQVLALQAGSVQGIFDGIAAIGRALGREPDAANLVDAMKRRIGAVHERGQAPSRAEPRRAGVDRSGLRDGQLGPGARRGGQRPPVAGRKRRTLQRHRLAAGARCRPRMAHHRALRLRPGAHHAARCRRWKRCRAGPTCARCGRARWCWPTATGTSTDPAPRSWRRWRSWRRSSTDTPAGHQGKAWVSYSRLRGTLLVRERHARRLREQPAHVYRSGHGIRRFHGRFPEAPRLLLRQRLPALPLPERSQAGALGREPTDPNPTVRPPWVGPAALEASHHPNSTPMEGNL